uniref:RH66770p n=1 Tax=Drosophila melanogaster TaxID=7227 RepID=Q5BIK8_DROME|nr:RH66770p [Drosophila melanogaster]
MRNGHTLVWHYAATFLVTAKITLFPLTPAESVRNLKI